MQNKILFFLSLAAFMLAARFSLAQETTNTNTNTPIAPEIIETVILRAEAGENKNVAIGRTITFDASSSTVPTDKQATYAWDFGDGTSYTSQEATHIYDRAGQFVVTLTVNDGENISEDFMIVSVEEQVVLLITDDSISPKEIKDLTDYAHQHGVLLVNVKNKKKQSADYITAEKLAQQLLASPDDFKQSNLILLWTENNIGLSALTEMARITKATTDDQETSGTPDAFSDASWNQKVVINVSDQKTGTSRIAQSTYNVLKPRYILLTEPSVLKTVIDNPDIDKILPALHKNGLAYQIISSHSQRSLENITPLNFMSYLISFLINKGVSQNTIFLILVLPVIATIISFARQVIGVKAFGIYVPSIIALTFLEINLRWGLFIFFILLIAGTLARLIARKLKLLYMPRMAIVLTLVSLTIFGMFVAGGYLDKTGLLSISIFPILMMIILTEKFIEVQIEKGNKEAIWLTLETLILSIISYLIVSWEAFKTIILAYPELIIITIILNLIFGRFSGLRVVEYFRFRKLFKNAPPATK
ncbi:MAG: 7TM domain-containing protein [Patescibacteria group bacterium]|jgi:PKD repeat protein